jgi:hypothetical protein
MSETRIFTRSSDSLSISDASISDASISDASISSDFLVKIVPSPTKLGKGRTHPLDERADELPLNDMSAL